MTVLEPTIVALSTAPGRSGVAVIRISGSNAGPALTALTRSLPGPRQATLRTIRNPDTGEALDQGLVLWFPGPASFTGEDMAELQIHGGRAVIQATMDSLIQREGYRLAEPGEFARRAFENGKLDLTAAEGLADLIDAQTEAQRRQALRQSYGALRNLYEDWRARLIHVLAMTEAALDFADEEDVPGNVAQHVRPDIEKLLSEIADHLDDRCRGEILRQGFRVVIAGAPNAGKSSLLNALAKRDAAIVSEEAGTTRDIIEVQLDLEGMPIVILDTAGIREPEGNIEQEGIRRALLHASDADLVLWLIDSENPIDELPDDVKTIDPKRVLRVQNKIDLKPNRTIKSAIAISALTGDGIDRLTSRLLEEAHSAIGANEEPVITRARHRAELEECRRSLMSYLENDHAQLELRAEDLRSATHALGMITGRVDVEDLLDKIFADFCIGK